MLRLDQCHPSFERVTSVSTLEFQSRHRPIKDDPTSAEFTEDLHVTSFYDDAHTVLSDGTRRLALPTLRARAVELPRAN
jgi:hypothetical protein